MKLKWQGFFRKCASISHLLLLTLSVRFSVGGTLLLNLITIWLSALTFHQTIYFQTADSTTDIIKHCHIHVHLFYIKLNVLLVALTRHLFWKCHETCIKSNMHLKSAFHKCYNRHVFFQISWVVKWIAEVTFWKQSLARLYSWKGELLCEKKVFFYK